MFMATITTTKLVLLVCVFALFPLPMEMMPLQPESAGTTCGVFILLVYTLWENDYFFYCKIAILRSRHMMHFGFIIKLVCCFGWLSGLSFGQVPFSDTLTGSVTFPALGITCLANLAVFYRCILRGVAKLDIGAKDLLPKDQNLKNINQLEGQTTDQSGGLTTCQESESLYYCGVVMLSKERPNSSMRQFMEYMSNVHNVDSISLQCHPAEPVTAGNCTCGMPCRCIVFKIGEQITTMLARRMPGTVKRLSDSQCLLPSLRCLRKGCHGCNQGLLHVESDGLREGESQVEFPAAVCALLDDALFPYDDFCICIPVRSASDDEWTKQLITLLELQENEGRFGASAALKNYIAGSGKCDTREYYNLFSLIIVPTLTEVLINIALTFWFKVDGFSSAFVARRAMKDYLPQSNGTGFSPIAFLTAASVKSNPNNTNVCQVLGFRGSRLSLGPLYFMMVSVSGICSISWMVLVALEGGANKWYHTHSMPPSEGRIIVIMVAIFIALVMDLHTLHNGRRKLKRFLSRRLYFTAFYVICTVIVLEILCIVSGSVVLGILGPKVFGRWLYSALQSLVWLKWMGNFFIHISLRSASDKDAVIDWISRKTDGRYIYASVFFLNAILAAVRAEWEFS